MATSVETATEPPNIAFDCILVLVCVFKEQILPHSGPLPESQDRGFAMKK